MQQNWTEIRNRLLDKYPAGAIPRQDLPNATGYKSSYFAAMATRGEGPEFYHQGRLAMYPIQPLVEWLRARSRDRSKQEG